MRRQMLSCRRWILLAPAILPALAAGGCRRVDPAAQVVVYTALDRQFSEPIFEEFTRATGIRVLAQYDTESTKTVGLAGRIRAERERPRCDVFWNNEILNTLRLKAEGLLEPCRPKEAESYPEEHRDLDGCWHGFAARARVIIASTEIVGEEERPRSFRDLADPKWKGRTGIAKPLFGTTASHVACLFVDPGPEAAVEYLRSLRENEVQIHGGNKGCAEAVAAGRCAFALTDTDDAIIEKDAGRPVEIIYPDQEDGGIGTLFLPNTLALVKGAPHRESAIRLIEFLLSPEVETMLADGRSAQIPLNRKSPPNPRIRGPREVRAMRVDFEKAAEAFETARQVVEEKFLR
ncbi:MAG: extracellular solute-binding protein [Planctomycetes bacterium]|nr:extracellular solute-binding protein [Planctomycetota bacterium]